MLSSGASLGPLYLLYMLLPLLYALPSLAFLCFDIFSPRKVETFIYYLLILTYPHMSSQSFLISSYFLFVPFLFKRSLFFYLVTMFPV